MSVARHSPAVTLAAFSMAIPKVFSALILGALLAGCAGMAKHDPIPADPVAIDIFELNGRVNIKVKAENKAYPGKIRWQHRGPEEDLWIYSPIGNLLARLEQDSETASITTSQGENYKAGTLAFLAKDVLGYDLPIDALQYWVRGLEWPKAAAANRVQDDKGRLVSLAQDKWQITYLAWTPEGSPGLPTKLNVENDEMRLSMVVDQWKFRNLERE